MRIQNSPSDMSLLEEPLLKVEPFTPTSKTQLQKLFKETIELEEQVKTNNSEGIRPQTSEKVEATKEQCGPTTRQQTRSNNPPRGEVEEPDEDEQLDETDQPTTNLEGRVAQIIQNIMKDERDPAKVLSERGAFNGITYHLGIKLECSRNDVITVYEDDLGLSDLPTLFLELTSSGKCFSNQSD